MILTGRRVEYMPSSFFFAQNAMTIMKNYIYLGGNAMKKLMRVAFVIFLNLITLPFIPVVFIIMTVCGIIQCIYWSENLRDTMEFTICLWKAMLNGMKWSIYANRIYINQDSLHGYDELIDAAERQETEAP